jgi:dihydroxyacetone kinase-like predicted kinase
MLVAAAETLARGALLGARGNSGVILSQVLRGVAEAVAAAEGPCAGAVLADALDRGAGWPRRPSPARRRARC